MQFIVSLLIAMHLSNKWITLSVFVYLGSCCHIVITLIIGSVAEEVLCWWCLSLQGLELHPSCTGLQVSAFMLTPVQRMPRYVLLLKVSLSWNHRRFIMWCLLPVKMLPLTYRQNFLPEQWTNFWRKWPIFVFQKSVLFMHCISMSRALSLIGNGLWKLSLHQSLKVSF